MTVHAFRTAASVLVFAATTLAAPEAPADSMSSQWHGAVGAGTGIVPDYVGSDGVKAMVLPVIDAYNGRFFASTSDGVGINLLANEPYNPFSERSSAAGIAVTYGLGRDGTMAQGCRGQVISTPAPRSRCSADIGWAPSRQSRESGVTCRTGMVALWWRSAAVTSCNRRSDSLWSWARHWCGPIASTTRHSSASAPCNRHALGLRGSISTPA
jgi:hypothetical protein